MVRTKECPIVFDLCRTPTSLGTGWHFCGPGWYRRKAAKNSCIDSGSADSTDIAARVSTMRTWSCFQEGTYFRDRTDKRLFIHHLRAADDLLYNQNRSVSIHLYALCY